MRRKGTDLRRKGFLLPQRVHPHREILHGCRIVAVATDTCDQERNDPYFTGLHILASPPPGFQISANYQDPDPGTQKAP